MSTSASGESSPNLPASAKIVIATTVALSFISFWRGAAIVLSDLASTMFYVGGIAEQAIGKSAPWFVLAVMLFSFAVRSIYMESSSMFVRGGVYVVVRDSMGPFLAKISVSALVVDYILTGPISVVSAGQYLGRLLNEIAELLHQPIHIDPNSFATVFGVLVTFYFWWANIKGIHESSSKALRIMQITTVMVVALLIWCPITLLLRGNVQLPPAPTHENLRFTAESLGWLEGTFWPHLAFAGLIIAFGHSLLAMSGFETLAQVYREIGYPKKTKGFLDQFAAGNIPLLALQPGGAGHGLDGLQDGGHHIAAMDMFHDWELFQQAVSRLDRSGQKHRVTVHLLLADKTKDAQVGRVTWLWLRILVIVPGLRAWPSPMSRSPCGL